PRVAAADRVLLVAALACVDAVTIFDEDTPRDLIAELLPDVLVKGADYSLDQVVGRAEVEAAGGSVVLVPWRPGYSSTDLVQRIRGKERGRCRTARAGVRRTRCGRWSSSVEQRGAPRAPAWSPWVGPACSVRPAYRRACPSGAAAAGAAG